MRSGVGTRIQLLGSKSIFLVGMALVPIRGVLVLLFYVIYANEILMLTTQVSLSYAPLFF